MADKKIKNFYGNVGIIAQVSDEFRDIFQAQIKERGQKQKDVLIAAIKIWMELPQQKSTQDMVQLRTGRNTPTASSHKQNTSPDDRESG